MSKSNTWENGLLQLVFNNVDFEELGDAGGLLGSVADGYLYVSLHTGDPGETGDQTTNEIAYTGYARQGVARVATPFNTTCGGWTVTNDSVSPAATIIFPAMGGGAGGTVTHVGIGTAATAAGKLLYSGTVTPNIPVAVPVEPEISTSSTIVEG
jgi:hypothetical protein